MKKIIIEDDVWVGYGVILMHGVTLGEGCIIAAGSLITKNVDSYMIVGGVPAKVIRNRFKDDTEINIHRSMLLNRNRRRK